MNMIAIKNDMTQAVYQSDNGKVSKVGTLPAGSFANLLNGMQGLEGELVQINNPTLTNLEELIAQLDQILAKLETAENDSKETSLLDMSNLNMNMADNPIQLLLSQPEWQSILFEQTQKLSIGSNETMLDQGSENLLPYSLSMNNLGNLLLSSLIQSKSSEGYGIVQADINQNVKFQELPPSIQQELLTTLRTILQTVKNDKTVINKEEIVKEGLFLQQVNDGLLAQKTGVNQPQSQRITVDQQVKINEVFSFIGKSRAQQNIMKADEVQSMSNESGKLPDPSSQTTKVGFHQLMGGAPSGSLGTTNQQETPVRAHTFQQDMNQFLVRQVQLTRFPNGVSEARLKLFPENLGSIEVRLSVQQGILTAQFIAETQAGKELLESHLNGLRNSLIQQGLHVDKMEIQVPNQQNNNQTQDSLARQGSGEREQPRNHFQQEIEEDSEQDFSELIESYTQQV